MRKVSLFLIDLLLAVALTAIFGIAHAIAGLVFLPFALFDVVARTLDGRLITFGIDSLISVIRALNIGRTDTAAKLAEQTMGVAAFIGLVLLLGGLFHLLMRGNRTSRIPLIAGSIFGLVVGVLITGITFSIVPAAGNLVNVFWGIVAFVAWGLAHGYSQTRTQATAPQTAVTSIPTPPEHMQVMQPDRRQFLIQLGGATAFLTITGATLNLVRSNSTPAPASVAAGNEKVLALPNANDPLIPAIGTRPEYTRQRDHYRIDINTIPPTVDEATYKLQIGGLVENADPITLDKIRSYPPMHQYITMSCISNDVGGDLIGTTRWTGVSMQRILELVKPKPEATHIRIEAADGFFEYVEIAGIRADERVMLAWAWDDEPLTIPHGFPLRIHIPDHYGMKQPKWITKMEFVDSWQPGYWVQRTWDREARVKATSVIDTIAQPQTVNGRKVVPIGGIAWAGARGVSRVEVQVDGGAWQPTQLRAPLSDKTWVIWRYDWNFTAGEHTFAVRCVEKDGTPQIEAEAGSHPGGATGLHSRKKMIQEV